MTERRPYEFLFPALEAPNVTPRAFAERWETRVNEWGRCIKQGWAVSLGVRGQVSLTRTRVEGITRTVGVGLGLAKDTFLEAGRYGWVA